VQNNVWGAVRNPNGFVQRNELQDHRPDRQQNSTSAVRCPYPSVFIGSNYNRSTEGSNLPSS
jgi:hypothetical protein